MFKSRGPETFLRPHGLFFFSRNFGFRYRDFFHMEPLIFCHIFSPIKDQRLLPIFRMKLMPRQGFLAVSRCDPRDGAQEVADG